MKVGAGGGLCNRSGSWWLMDSQKGNDAMGRNKRKVGAEKTSRILNFESSWMFSKLLPIFWRKSSFQVLFSSIIEVFFSKFFV